MFQNLRKRMTARRTRPSGRNDAGRPPLTPVFGESARVLSDMVARLQAEGQNDLAGLVTAAWLHSFHPVAMLKVDAGPTTPGVDGEAFLAGILNELGGGANGPVVTELLANLLKERDGTPLPADPAALRRLGRALQLPGLIGRVDAALYTGAAAELAAAAAAATSPRAIRDGYAALGYLYALQAARADSVEHWRAAVEALRQAVAPERLGPDDPGPGVRDLDDLGSSLYRLFELTTDPALVKDSARHHALALERAEGPRRVDVLDNLGAALFRQAETQRDPRALRRSVAAYQEALGVVPRGEPRWWTLTEKLLHVLQLVPGLCGAGRDLDGAIKWTRSVLRGCPRNSRYAWRAAEHLGCLFSARFQLRRDAKDLDAAIRHRRQAHSACPRTETAWATLSCDLGAALATRYELTHDRSDLKEAISHMSEAVGRLPAHLQPVARHNLREARRRWGDAR